MQCSLLWWLLPQPPLCSAEGGTMCGKAWQEEGSDSGWTATGTGRSHQVLQAASATLMGTLDQGPAKILFTGEIPLVCWRCCLVKLHSILRGVSKHWLWEWGPSSWKQTLLTITHRGFENYQELPPLQKTSTPQNFCSPWSEELKTHW